MKIQILARLGMLESELRTIQSLGQALPEHWKAYCGIELILPRQKMREIDMLIVADDRIIVTEIKEWNGDSITSDGKSWFTSRQNSVSGPKTHGVNQVTGAWKMLMNRIREKRMASISISISALFKPEPQVFHLYPKKSKKTYCA